MLFYSFQLRKCHQNAFGTVPAFVQQTALWPKTGPYKHYAQTGEDSVDLVLLLEAEMMCLFEEALV